MNDGGLVLRKLKMFRASYIHSSKMEKANGSDKLYNLINVGPKSKAEI